MWVHEARVVKGLGSKICCEGTGKHKFQNINVRPQNTAGSNRVGVSGGTFGGPAPNKYAISTGTLVPDKIGGLKYCWTLSNAMMLKVGFLFFCRKLIT